jgi:hypothetical protein
MQYRSALSSSMSGYNSSTEDSMPEKSENMNEISIIQVA